MRYGVIDIGSNTIRAVAYQIENRRATKIEDKLICSHILDETENEMLTDSGIRRLVVVLNKLLCLLKNADCEKISCFSTSPLRKIKNLGVVLDSVYDTTGIRIDVLTGVQEAEYDFIALRAHVPEHCGIGLDLGGGSCQMLQFEQSKLLFSKSFDIGSLFLKKKLVSGLLPTPEERKKIDFYLRNVLSDVHNSFGARYLYAMGGTAKAALSLYQTLSNNKQRDTFLSVAQLERLSALGDRNPEDVYRRLGEILKNRADTIIPGITILLSICNLLGTKGIYVLHCGVRDGYLIKMYEKNQK